MVRCFTTENIPRMYLTESPLTYTPPQINSGNCSNLARFWPPPHLKLFQLHPIYVLDSQIFNFNFIVYMAAWVGHTSKKMPPPLLQKHDPAESVLCRAPKARLKLQVKWQTKLMSTMASTLY
jgi:hypothetical protein